MDEEQRAREEAGLRAAVLAGDEAAWRVLYERHFDRLYYHILSRCGRDVHRAEETVQDCWAVAVRRIRAFDPQSGAFEQWLHGIAEHVMLNGRRRWARRMRLLSETTPPAAPVTDTDYETADKVAVVMAGLPEDYRTVLTAKYEEHRSVADIAMRSRRTPKAIESLLSRARAAFRDAWTRLDSQ